MTTKNKTQRNSSNCFCMGEPYFRRNTYLDHPTNNGFSRPCGNVGRGRAGLVYEFATIGFDSNRR